MAIAVWIFYESKPSTPSAPPGNVHFTFGVTDLYAPFLKPAENAAVLDSLPQGAEFSATYRQTSYTYDLFSCLVGVACIPDPHWESHSKEEIRQYPASIAPQEGNGQGDTHTTRTFSVDIPQSLDGGYVLASIYFTVSADTFYRQPSYRAVLAQTRVHPKPADYDLSPAFEYMVDYSDHGRNAGPRYEQDCLDVWTPYGFPEIRIPIVTKITTDSKRLALTRLSHTSCPSVDDSQGEASPVDPARLAPGRIAAAQSKIDFTGVKGPTFLAGLIPISEAMTRWHFTTNKDVRVYLTEVGPLRQLEIRTVFDNAHPSNPVRTETWTLFDNTLVGYAGTWFYDSGPNGNDLKTIEWREYFHDGKSVATSTTPTYCDDPHCKSGLSEISAQMSRSYGDLQAEARSYFEFRSRLRPEARD